MKMLLLLLSLCSLSLSTGSSAVLAAQASNQILLTEAEQAWLKQNPEVTVAVSHGWAPVEFLDKGS